MRMAEIALKKCDFVFDNKLALLSDAYIIIHESMDEVHRLVIKQKGIKIFDDSRTSPPPCCIDINVYIFDQSEVRIVVT